MNIAIATNETFVKYAYVMLTSLLENNRDREISIYVLMQDEKLGSILKNLENKYKVKIDIISMPDDIFPVNMVYTDFWPMEIWYRTALPILLPKEVERILYLDVDVVICKSLDKLYDVDFDGAMFAAAVDDFCPEGKQRELFKDHLLDSNFRYFNSGVLLMNIEEMRRTNAFQLIVEKAVEKKELLSMPDQDILNFLYWDRIKYIDDLDYNFLARLQFKNGKGYKWAKDNATIVHYAGHKPWDNMALHYETERFWWEYAAKTDIYLELLEKLVLEIVDSNFWFNCVNELCEERDILLRDNDELKQIVAKCQMILKKLS